MSDRMPARVVEIVVKYSDGSLRTIVNTRAEKKFFDGLAAIQSERECRTFHDLRDYCKNPESA